MTVIHETDKSTVKAGKARGRVVTPVRGLIPVVVILLAWQILGSPDSAYFPPPSEWYRAVVKLITAGQLFPAIASTSVSFILGLAIATVLGTVLGGALGASRRADRAWGPTFEFLRVLPAAALVPLVSLLLGYTLQMKLVIIVLVAMWPVLLNCRTRRRTLSPTLLAVSQALHLSRSERFRKILIPSILPGTLLGVSIAAPLALIITLLVEIVTSVDGLGRLLTLAQASYRSAEVYGLLVVAGILGFIVNEIVALGQSLSTRMSGGVDVAS